MSGKDDIQKPAVLSSKEAESTLQELLPKLVSQLEASGEAARAKEKRDRLVQIGTEYWKTQFEFSKHLMTITVASIAAFGALLGGLYNDPASWNFGSEQVRSTVIYGIFLFLLTALIQAGSASLEARENILLMKDVETDEDLSSFLAQRNSGPWAGLSLTVAMLLFVAFVAISGNMWRGSFDMVTVGLAITVIGLLATIIVSTYIRRRLRSRNMLIGGRERRR